MRSVYIYILIMGGVSYLIRVLPVTIFRKPIKSRFVQSFLYYVPYVTLAVMPFPAIVEATRSPLAGALDSEDRHPYGEVGARVKERPSWICKEPGAD